MADGDVEVVSLEVERDENPQSVAEIAAKMVDAIASHTGDLPFGLFGHSFGALLAFEACLELRRRKLELPVCLFLSAHRSPDQPSRTGSPNTFTHTLGDEAFREVAASWGLIPQALLANDELMSMVLPPLRADLRLDETYRFERQDETPLDVRGVVYGGRSDGTVSRSELAQWRPFFGTRRDLIVDTFDGGHFYLFDSQAEVLDSIARHMREALDAAGPSCVAATPVPFMRMDDESRHVMQRFAEQVAQNPDQHALEDGERHWTYRQLADASAVLAATFSERGVKRDSVVGILMPHCAEHVIALLATLYTGARACLLENSWPSVQLAEFVAACDVTLIVTVPALEERVVAAVQDTPRITLDAGWMAGMSVARTVTAFQPVAVSGDDIALVSMTSGSTGKPKAVLTTHRGCTFCFLARFDRYPYTDDDAREGLNVFFAWECLRALLCGRTAVVIPDAVIFDPPRLLSFIQQARITRLVVTPSLLENLLDHPVPERARASQWTTLRHCFLMGEVVPGSLVAKASRTLPPHVRLINAYSSWEALDVSYADLLPYAGGAGHAPVGHLLPGVAALALDPQGRAVPRGAAGELYVGGPGLAPGYLHDDTRTAERFVEVPQALAHATGGVQRLYRTGDLARLRADGQWVVLGRIDSTVKIRGFKVGLHGVERAIDDMEGVARSVVLPVDDPQGGQPRELVAYVVGREGKPSAALLARVRRETRRRLPEYAVPAYFIGLAELPMREGESRKLDRRALPPPRDDASAASVEPASLSAFEQRIANVWREVLGVDTIHSADNFFESGGNSLEAARLVGLLAQRLGVTMSIVDVYQHSTLQAMSRFCRGEKTLAMPARSAPRSDTPKLAVIGMAGRFPGAPSLEAFWELLQSGTDALRVFTRDELKAKGVRDTVLDHPSWVRAGQVLDDADQFDAAFFGIGRHEATLMDPQHRLFMEVAWHALEQAGYARRDNPWRERTAVYAACGIDGYLVHHLKGGGLVEPLDPGKQFLTEIGNEKDYVATRVAYRLDLGGPAVTVTSACSSGLIAVAQAAQALMSGQCDMAVAGASALNFPNFGYCYEDGLVGSADGTVRPFDQQASGTLFGDGVGAVVLKRLDDAIADGDDVWAVLSGYGMSNDGRMKAAYAAPSAAAQTRCIVDAMRMAGVHAEQVSYVEAHATATHIGDAVELKGLTDAFALTREHDSMKPGSCALGSVKGNIGHANCAAGITGFIKTVLCLRHRRLVPTVHFREPNAKLVEFVEHDDTPFHINRALSNWDVTHEQVPRRAGVSSFGIGGTNAHVILEEAPARDASGVGEALHGFVRSHQVLCVSARSERALSMQIDRLGEALKCASAADMANAAYTLHTARDAHPFRVAVSVHAEQRDRSGLLQAARQHVRRTDDGHEPMVVFCFSGQGSQHAGMARQLYEGRADGGRFRAHFDAACAALAPHLGFDPCLPILCADDEAMRRPVLTQCGLFAVEYALATSVVEIGARPAAVAGHSIGEYAACVTAGVLTLHDAAALVAARATACEALDLRDGSGSAAAGGMLAVAGDESVIREYVARRDDVWLAVHNAPGRIVIAGLRLALEQAREELEQLGCRCVDVPVSHPFHSALMAPVAARIEEAARGIVARRPVVPMTSNVSGLWAADDMTSPDYWSRHLLSTVQWAADVDTLLQWRPDVLVEIGPGTVLTKLLGRRAPDAQVLSALPGAHNGIEDEAAWADLVGRLWCAGVSLDWHAYHRGELASPGVPLGRMTLPGYAFDRQSYWVNPDASIYVPTAARRDVTPAGIDDAPAVAPAWLVRYGRTARPALTLYCLAFAGGSSRHFQPWAQRAEPWLDVVAVELPGRNARAEEPLPRDDTDDALVLQALAAAIRADAADRPFALCGVSYGAALAAELLISHLADLDQRGQCMALAVVGHAAPVDERSVRRDVDAGRFLIVPDELKANAVWQTLYRPMLEADLASDVRGVERVLARFAEHESWPLLRCDLMLQGALYDPACSPDELNAWSRLTTGAHATAHFYEGGHDFIVRDDETIFARLQTWLGWRAAPTGSSILNAAHWQPLPARRDTALASIHRVELVAGEEIRALSTLLQVLQSADAVVTVVYRKVDGVDRTRTRYQGMVALLQGLVQADARGRLILLLPACTASGPLAGLARVAAHEGDDLHVQCVFFADRRDRTHRATDDWLAPIQAAAHAPSDEADFYWNGTSLMALRLLPQAQTPMPAGVLSSLSGVFVITGGTGALGRALIDWLIDAQCIAPARIVVLVRSLSAKVRAGVRQAECALADPVSVDAALHKIDEANVVAGAFHLAGALDDCAFRNLDEARLEHVLAPKLALASLLPALASRGCAWAVAYSSTSALLGTQGQANYAAANAWLDHLAQWPDDEQAAVPVFSIAWGSWQGDGMAAGDKVAASAREQGETPLAAREALSALGAVLSRVIAGDAPRRLVICDVDWPSSAWRNLPLVSQWRGRPASTQAPVAGPANDRANPALAEPARSLQAPSATASDDPVRTFLGEYVHRWDDMATLADAGLDSLDVAQLRSGFNRRFDQQVPLSVFAAPNLTLGELSRNLAAHLAPAVVN